jgi:hypothetical protein
MLKLYYFYHVYSKVVKIVVKLTAAVIMTFVPPCAAHQESGTHLPLSSSIGLFLHPDNLID